MMHAHKLVLPLFAAIFAGATPCDALELFVAPGGNDLWSGKVSEVAGDGSDGPFATPQRAVQAAREWRAASADAPAPVTIRLRGGLHRMRQTLVLTPSDSGTAAAPLIIEACPGEQPVLSGGRRISGWTVGPDGRWHVTLPEARDGRWKLHQLFVNGQRRFAPRVPRQGYHYVRGRSREQEVGARKFFVNPGEIQPWRNLADIEVILFHQWVSSRHTIESFDTATHSVLLKDSARWLIGTFESNQRYYLENVAEALGAPGDWYLDRTSGELTYCPLAGETPAETEVIAPVLRTLVSFEGDPAAGRFVEHVTLRCLSLRHAERGVAPADMAKDNQSSVDGFDAAIRARGLLHSTLENCEVTHVGEHAVRLHEGCRANRIERCHLHDLGGGGIYLGEAQIPHHEGRAPAAAPMQTGGTTIRHNVIHHVAPFNPRLLANGIYLDEGSSHILVENNLVHAVEGCAFLLHFGHDNLVRNNIFAVQGSLDPFCFRKALDPQNQVTFERNIIIDQDRADWFPKFAAPSFQMDRNLYWDATGHAPLFNGNTLQQWQALGHDRHSLFADPQFQDASRLDIRLAADSPAHKLGFVPFDPAQAGLTGDADWVKLPAQYRDRPLAARTAPPPPAPRPIHTDYEQQAVKEWPWDAVTWALLANKRNVITNEDAAGERQSLKLTSAVTFYEPRLRDCAVRVACDVKLNAARPARLDLQLRDWRGDPFKALTYIAFQPDGSIDANGILTRVQPGTWMHVELTFELRPQAPGFGSYKLRITPADGTPVERTLPLADATCRELTWLGLVMEETSAGTAYVDNLVCEPLLAASPAQPAPKP